MTKITHRVAIGGSPRKLEQEIAESSEAKEYGLSKALIRKLLMAGAVYVNGKRVRGTTRSVRGGEIVDIYWDKDLHPEKATREKFLPLRVLYDDEAVICFDKPAGLPTQPTVDGSRANLYELAQKQLNAQKGKPAYLGLHHRLDRDTSGVILFTLDKVYNAFIADQFKGHKCSKVYVAVVHGKLKNAKGTLETFMGPVGKKGKQSKFGSVRSGGKKAITDYLVLATKGEGANARSLLEVRITTGRTHQIRVHFSELGHPIVGDTLYGSPVKEYNHFGRFLLHAHALSIEHPITKNLIRVESPIPQEFRF